MFLASYKYVNYNSIVFHEERKGYYEILGNFRRGHEAIIDFHEDSLVVALRNNLNNT